MTVTATPRRAGPYAGTGALTSFTFAFKVFAKTDIAVVMSDTTGLETTLLLDSDYSVTLNSDQSVSPGGVVSYPLVGSAMATGYSLAIVGALPYEQTTDLPDGGAWNASVVEGALDRVVMQSQQLAEVSDRTLTLAATAGEDVSAALPAPVAGAVLGWDATGTEIVNISGLADVAVSSFMEPVVASASAAAAAELLGVGATDSPTFAEVSLTGGVTSGFRNRVINGDMRIDQRNSGGAQTYTAGAALAYAVDRWYGYCTGANVQGIRAAGSGGSQYRYRFSGVAGITAIGFGQRIEAADVYDLVGDNATLSVDLYNSSLTSVNWAVYYSAASDAFGTLAAPTRTLISSGTFTVDNTYTRYNATFAVPAGAAGRGIEIVLSVGAQISGAWDIGDVSLTRGSAASLFERRPYAIELALCQRFHQAFIATAASQDVGIGFASATNTALIGYKFAVPMRAAPTIAWTSGAFSVGFAGSTVVTNTWVVRGTGHKDYVTLQGTPASSPFTAGQGAYLFSNASTAVFSFSAEL